MFSGGGAGEEEVLEGSPARRDPAKGELTRTSARLGAIDLLNSPTRGEPLKIRDEDGSRIGCLTDTNLHISSYSRRLYCGLLFQ